MSESHCETKIILDHEKRVWKQVVYFKAPWVLQKILDDLLLHTLCDYIYELEKLLSQNSTYYCGERSVHSGKCSSRLHIGDWAPTEHSFHRWALSIYLWKPPTPNFPSYTVIHIIYNRQNLHWFKNISIMEFKQTHFTLSYRWNHKTPVLINCGCHSECDISNNSNVTDSQRVSLWVLDNENHPWGKITSLLGFCSIMLHS